MVLGGDKHIKIIYYRVCSFIQVGQTSWKPRAGTESLEFRVRLWPETSPRKHLSFDDSIGVSKVTSNKNNDHIFLVPSTEIKLSTDTIWLVTVERDFFRPFYRWERGGLERVCALSNFTQYAQNSLSRKQDRSRSSERKQLFWWSHACGTGYVHEWGLLACASKWPPSDGELLN